jgi:hypothetical protein
LAAGQITGQIAWTATGFSATTYGQIDARYFVTGQPYAYRLTISSPASSKTPYKVQFWGNFENPSDALHLQYVSGPLNISQAGVIVPNPIGVPGQTFGILIEGWGCSVGGCIGDTGNSVTFTLELTPLADFKLSNDTVAGCKSVTGLVELLSPAPAGGVVLSVSDTLASATTPATVTISEGATKKSFSIKTTPVAANESGTVTVNLGGASLSQPLTVRPMGMASVSLTPTSVVGSQPVTGKATLECKAGPGPITVDLSSTNATVASPVAANIVVPQGVQSANFDVTTNAVQTRSYATIAGTANGITKSKKLTVNVAAAVAPISLKFGSVAVGQTSAPLNATLTNKGAVAFSVDSISLSGTAASWFAQTNNCPASLAAGASCTIGVTFTPQAAASKSAKLAIQTSATSTPLSVSVSGTGI